MKKTIFFRVLAGTLSVLLLFSVCGCTKQTQEEKARVTMIEIIDDLLDYDITIAEATEQLESMYIPTDTAEGYAMSKYKEDLLSSLERAYLDGLESTRDVLDRFNNNKESDYYYKTFQNQFRNNDSFRDYTAFMAVFNDLLSKLPEYTVTQLQDVELDFEVSHTYIIRGSWLEDSYRLRIDTDKDNKVTWAYITGERGTYANLQFAVFAAYTYRSMGFEIEDSDAFYKQYDLFSREEIYEAESIGDYRITSMTIGADTLSFSIRAI